MSPRTYPQTPAEVLDYGWDFERWLEDVADTIATSVWVVDVGLDVISQGNDNTGTSVFVAGGILGERYNLTNRITTVGGRTAERRLRVEIVEARYA